MYVISLLHVGAVIRSTCTCIMMIAPVYYMYILVHVLVEIIIHDVLYINHKHVHVQYLVLIIMSCTFVYICTSSMCVCVCFSVNCYYRFDNIRCLLDDHNDFSRNSFFQQQNVMVMLPKFQLGHTSLHRGIVFIDRSLIVYSDRSPVHTCAHMSSGMECTCTCILCRAGWE